MQATPPIGTMLVTPLLASGHLPVGAIVMTLVAGLPAIYLVLAVPDREETL